MIIVFGLLLLIVAAVQYRNNSRRSDRHGKVPTIGKGWSIFLINETFEKENKDIDFSKLKKNELPPAHQYEHVKKSEDSPEQCFREGELQLKDANKYENRHDFMYNMVFCGLNCKYSDEALHELSNENMDLAPGNLFDLDQISCEKVEFKRFFS